MIQSQCADQDYSALSARLHPKQSGSYYQREQIYAPMGGMVTHAGETYLLGWTVVVQNNRIWVILGHMCCGYKGTSGFPTGESPIRVEPGALIRAGEVVGRTGETGNSTGIHLHFEVRHYDRDGRCQIQNASDVSLPGTDSLCSWDKLESE